MAKTYGDLRNAIAAYMHRDASSFIVEGVDMLLQAVNNAKNFCQRAVDLERARVFAQIDNVSVTSGGDLSSAVLMGTATPVTMKSIERCFMDTSDGNGQFPVDFISRETYVARLKRRFNDITRLSDANSQGNVPNTTRFLSVMQYGSKVYVAPASTSVYGAETVTLYFDALSWLDDFATSALTGSNTSTGANQLIASGGTFVSSGVKIGDTVQNTTSGASALVTGVTSNTTLQLNSNIFPSSGVGYQVDYVPAAQTNFLLDYCFDYLTFRSMYELNFFLKEDVRVPISKALLDEVWNNVVKWNSTIIGNSVDDANLD